MAIDQWVVKAIYVWTRKTEGVSEDGERSTFKQCSVFLCSSFNSNTITPAFVSLFRVLVNWLTNKVLHPLTKWPCVSSSPLVIAYFIWYRAGKCEVKSLWACMCLDVFVRVIVRTRLWREDDSKCHFVVWGQPSQTHSSCRRCCHPPPHCLCKWCLQSPSNTWRFHPPSVTLLLCFLLRLNKLSHRPSAPALSHLFCRCLLKRT